MNNDTTQSPDRSGRLSDAVVRALPAPDRGNRITYDQGNDAIRGFGLRVTAAGAKSFILNYTARVASAVSRSGRTRYGRSRRPARRRSSYGSLSTAVRTPSPSARVARCGERSPSCAIVISPSMPSESAR